MKVSKWVDFGTEVDVLIDANDIAGAIGEAWQRVVRDRFEEDGPTRGDVISAMTRSLHFFKALKDEHIADLTDQQREVLAKLLTEQADRFASRCTNSAVTCPTCEVNE